MSSSSVSAISPSLRWRSPWLQGTCSVECFPAGDRDARAADPFVHTGAAPPLFLFLLGPARSSGSLRTFRSRLVRGAVQASFAIRASLEAICRVNAGPPAANPMRTRRRGVRPPPITKPSAAARPSAAWGLSWTNCSMVSRAWFASAAKSCSRSESPSVNSDSIRSWLMGFVEPPCLLLDTAPHCASLFAHVTHGARRARSRLSARLAMVRRTVVVAVGCFRERE